MSFVQSILKVLQTLFCAGSPGNDEAKPNYPSGEGYPAGQQQPQQEQQQAYPPTRPPQQQYQQQPQQQPQQQQYRPQQHQQQQSHPNKENLNRFGKPLQQRYVRRTVSHR